MLVAKAKIIGKNKLFRALRRTTNTAAREGQWIAYNWAITYRNLVLQNLVSQKYAGFYKPYTRKYAQWKLKRAGHLKFWQLSGALMSNISTFRMRGYDTGKASTTWAAGVHPSAVNAEGKKIAMYGYVMEHGYRGAGQNHPARPLFSLSAIDFWEGTQKASAINAAISKVAASWR